VVGPSGPGWREEIARFQGGSGHQLVGILTLPTTDHRQPATAVVVIHGWGTCRSGPHRMLVELCRSLAAAGFPALRFDLAGRGDSGGDFWSVDLDAMIADARAAGDFLAKATGARALAAAGLCSGANVALGAAAGDGRFRAAAALSALPFQKQRGAAQAAARTRGTLGRLLARAASPDAWRRLMRGEIAVGGILRRLLRGEGGRSAQAQADGGARRNLKDSRRDIQAELAGCRGRLLFVHGGADAEGLSGWRGVFAPFLAAAKVEHRHLAIAGADHDYHALAAKRQVLEAVVGFLSGEGGC
jgi:dienelactone hydrolase